MRGGWEVADAELAAAQQRRRHVHGRDEGGRPLERRARDAFGRVGRLRQRRLARRVRRPRAHAEPAVPQPRRRHVRGHHREGRRRRAAFTKGTIFGDYDNDGYPDLYVSNMFGDNLLYHNNRDGTFTDVAKTLARREAVRELSDVVLRLRQRRLARHLRVVVRDVGRGVREVLPATSRSRAKTLALYHNNHDGTFTDVTEAVGLDRVVPVDGRQLRRPRQRRLPRHVSRAPARRRSRR